RGRPGPHRRHHRPAGRSGRGRHRYGDRGEQPRDPHADTGRDAGGDADTDQRAAADADTQPDADTDPLTSARPAHPLTDLLEGLEDPALAEGEAAVCDAVAVAVDLLCGQVPAAPLLPAVHAPVAVGVQGDAHQAPGRVLLAALHLPVAVFVQLTLDQRSMVERLPQVRL